MYEERNREKLMPNKVAFYLLQNDLEWLIVSFIIERRKYKLQHFDDQRIFNY